MKRYADFLQPLIGVRGRVDTMVSIPLFTACESGNRTITEVGEDYVVCSDKSGDREVFPLSIFLVRVGPGHEALAPLPL